MPTVQTGYECKEHQSDSYSKKMCQKTVDSRKDGDVINCKIYTGSKVCVGEDLCWYPPNVACNLSLSSALGVGCCPENMECRTANGTLLFPVHSKASDSMTGPYWTEEDGSKLKTGTGTCVFPTGTNNTNSLCDDYSWEDVYTSKDITLGGTTYKHCVIDGKTQFETCKYDPEQNHGIPTTGCIKSSIDCPEGQNCTCNHSQGEQNNPDCPTGWICDSDNKCRFRRSNSGDVGICTGTSGECICDHNQGAENNPNCREGYKCDDDDVCRLYIESTGNQPHNAYKGDGSSELFKHNNGYWTDTRCGLCDYYVENGCRWSESDYHCNKIYGLTQSVWDCTIQKPDFWGFLNFSDKTLCCPTHFNPTKLEPVEFIDIKSNACSSIVDLELLDSENKQTWKNELCDYYCPSKVQQSRYVSSENVCDVNYFTLCEQMGCKPDPECKKIGEYPIITTPDREVTYTFVDMNERCSRISN